MKETIAYLVTGAILITLLLGIGFMRGVDYTQNETFSPPSTGTGRETEEPCKLPASYETLEIIEETAPETALETDSASYQQVTEYVVEDIYVPDTEELVEVIPAVEGKYLDVPMSAELQDYARNVSEEYGIPFELTMAVIYVESGFNAAAISSTGDYGLMQISYINHASLSNELNINDFLDPYQNIRAGVHVLAEKIRESGGDLTIALMKYNRGNAVALQQMSQGIFSTPYTDKVLSKYYEYIRG